MKRYTTKKKAKSLTTASQMRCLIGLGVFTGTFLGLAFGLSFWPKTYETSATVLVRPMESVGIDVNSIVAKDSVKERVNNQIALLTSDQTAQRADDFLKEFLQTSACDVCKQVIPQVKLAPLGQNFTLAKNYGRYLQERISVSPKPNSHVVRVTYSSDTDRPEDFRTLLSLYLSAFQMEATSFGQEMMAENLQVLQEHLELAKSHQDTTQKALEAFRKQHKTLNPDAELNGLVLQQAHLQEALSQTQANLKALEKARVETQKALSLSVPTVQWLARLAQDDELVALRRQLIKIYTEKAALMSKRALSKQLKLTIKEASDSTSGGKALSEKQSNDPAVDIKIETVDEEIRYVNKLINSRIQALLKSWQKTLGQTPGAALKQELDAGRMATVSSIDVQLAIRALEEDIQTKALGSKKAALQGSLNKLKQSLKNVPTLQKGYAELNARVTLAQNTRRELELEKARLENMQPGDHIPAVVLLQKPRTPLEPVAPNETLLYGLAALVALVIGSLSAAAFKTKAPKTELDLDFDDNEQPWEKPAVVKGKGQLSPVNWEDDFAPQPPVKQALPKAMEPEAKAKPLLKHLPAKSTPAPKAPSKEKASWWPFGKKSEKKNDASKNDRKKAENRILPTFRNMTEEPSEPEMLPTKQTQGHFHLPLAPLPDLSAFIEQMEGEEIGILASPQLDQLQGYLNSVKQQAGVKRIGVVPISAFITAQASLLALSLLMAESGRKIALIDFDFSDLSLSKWLSTLPIPLAKGLQKGSGVSEYLEGKTSDFIDLIYPLGKSVFGSLIPAGHIGGVSGLSVGPEHLNKLAGDLSPHYDFVLYALPALDTNQAALRIGPELDGLVLISHPGITKPKEYDQALKLIQQSGIRLLGVLEQP